VDYLSGRKVADVFSLARARKINAFITKYRSDYSIPRIKARQRLSKAGFIPNPLGWRGIQTDREHTFSILYVELDNEDDLRKRYEKRHLQTAVEKFKQYISGLSGLFNGRMWFWSGFSGIILFPFDGDICRAAECGFRLVLYKHLHDVEGSHFPQYVSFRMALHLGNLLYREKNTGEIISDALNTVCHIGKKYLTPGRFYITEEAQEFVSPPLEPFFTPVGSFENRTIFKMKLPRVIPPFRRFRQSWLEETHSKPAEAAVLRNR
jgi:hypothetical protein